MDENPVPSYIAIFKQDLLIISRKKVDRFFFFKHIFCDGSLGFSLTRQKNVSFIYWKTLLLL